MIKKSVGLAAAAALMLALGACSDDEGGDAAYCDEVEAAKGTLDGLDADIDQAAFDEARDQLEGLAEAAPTDLDGDYQAVTDGLDELEALFEDAGVSFDDIEALSSGEVPEGADVEKLQELGSQIEELDADGSVEDSVNAIQADAEERCDITFDDSEN